MACGSLMFWASFELWMTRGAVSLLHWKSFLGVQRGNWAHALRRRSVQYWLGIVGFASRVLISNRPYSQ